MFNKLGVLHLVAVKGKMFILRLSIKRHGLLLKNKDKGNKHLDHLVLSQILKSHNNLILLA